MTTTPVTPEMAAQIAYGYRSSAYTTLSGLAFALDQGFGAVRNAVNATASWTDDFWEKCGYDKTETLARLDSLAKLAGAYTGTNGLAGTHDYQEDAAALKEQAPVEAQVTPA